MKKQNEHLDGYLAEMRKANCLGDDYWRKNAGQIVRLTNGGYFVVEKSRIKTSFCFGYSTDYTGHEHSDAEKARLAFLENAKAFKAKNLADIDEIIADLESNSEDITPVLRRVEYYRQSEPVNVYEIVRLHYWELMRKYGDGSSISIKRIAELCPSDADREIIINAYKAERDSLNKRLDAYLKRYGMKHLRTWVYWRDE